MAIIDLDPVEAFDSGTPRVFSVNSVEIGVIRWGDKWYAVRNICPHLGARICGGAVQPYLSECADQKQDLIVDRNRPMIVCPWHHWEFDLKTGASIDGQQKLRTYPVTVRDGRVTIEIATPGDRAKSI